MRNLNRHVSDPRILSDLQLTECLEIRRARIPDSGLPWFDRATRRIAHARIRTHDQARMKWQSRDAGHGALLWESDGRRKGKKR